MHVAIVTAGGAGMFCGSCMLDNTLARALVAAGVEVTLIPTYTPIRTDEDNVSMSRVFFGGINVYLDSKIGFWKRLPSGLVRWLNHPRIISLATRLSVSNDARKLGDLTVQMLDGAAGPQKREVDELVRFLATELRPDAVLFSNALLSGVMPALREHYGGKVFCLLQGDDIFLDELVEPWRRNALSRLQRNARLFDGMLTHSKYYRDHMMPYVDLPADRFHCITPGIDLTGHSGTPVENRDPFTIGYFARVCPEKGFELAVEAFRILHQRRPNSRMLAAGYLGKRDTKFFKRVMRSARGLGEALRFCGSPGGREEKIQFLQQLDLLSVPTTYREPKGLYVLEAMANGVPVVQPRHGAFPELVERTGGGRLFEPGNPKALADELEALMLDSAARKELADTGHQAVHSLCGAANMAGEVLAVLRTASGP